MTVVEAFGELADMLAHLDPAKVVLLKAPKEMGERVELLVQKKKDVELSNEETVELERYLALDLLINLTKARAQHLLAA